MPGYPYCDKTKVLYFDYVVFICHFSYTILFYVIFVNISDDHYPLALYFKLLYYGIGDMK